MDARASQFSNFQFQRGFENMAYDLEKYRDKREKVLGVRKRGVSLGALAAMVSVVIVVGLAVIALPKSIAWFESRNLDDAIYRLQGEGKWPKTMLAEILALDGVRSVETDTHGSRLVVTFDTSKINMNHVSSLFRKSDIDVILLNRVSHGQRMSTLKEEADFEAL